MLRSVSVAILSVAFLSVPAGGQVVINEVLYDSPGSDVGTFTEIAGPAGTSLDGYELVGVNGNGGADYNTIDLSGNSIGSSGFFVVAQDMTVPNTDIIDSSVDWQNGPDQVQLRLGGVEVDSVCYGSTPDLVCEGAAATDVPGGTSLTRDANSTDSDDNSEDFIEDPNPTPGGPFAGTCNAPSDLNCTSDCGPNDVTLSWTNNDTYVSIDVLLDGAPLATGLPGTDTSYVDAGRAPGAYTYTVVGNCASGSGMVLCGITHCLVADPNLIITEVVDGTLAGGRPRWVEVTNCGMSTIDLSAYSIGNFNNGSLELGGGTSTGLAGMLAGGDSFVFEYDSVADTVFETVYGFPSDQLAGGNFINGDDVIALFFGPATTDGMGVLTGTIIDVFGELGVDGTGEVWEYLDSYARRNPNATQSDVFDPDAWTYGGSNALDGSDPMTEDDEIALMVALTFPAEHTCTGAASCDAVTDLACSSDCVTNDVTLSWTNADAYDTIDVLLNGMTIAAGLPGTDTSYVDAGRPPGIYTYTVVVNCTGLSGATSCDIVHCPPPLDPNIVITEIVDGTLAGGRPRWVELTNCGGATIDLNFYSLGNFNNGSLELGGGSSTLLNGMLAGGDSYIFEYDSSADTRFEEVYGFPSDQLAGGGFINGNDAVALFFGPATTDGMGVLDGMIIDVYGVVGQDGVDEDWEYTDGYSFRNPGATQTAVFDSMQWTFGGLGSLIGPDDTMETDEIMLLQTLTFPDDHNCGDPGDTFLRGDADGDGTYNGLIDGLRILGFQFIPGTPPPPCLEAADADGDAVFNGLQDGIFVLSCQFTPGSPCPPLPYPDCGADPDPGTSLGCDTPLVCP